MHKSQALFYLLVSFLSGTFIASVLNIGQFFIYIGLITAIGLVGIFGYKKSFNRPCLLIGFMMAAFLFGVARFNSANFDHGKLDFFTGLKAGQKNIEVAVNGYVDDEPVNDNGYQRIIVRAKEIVVGDKMVLVDDRISITINSFPKFNYGDIVSVSGALQKPQNLGVPLEVRRPSIGSSADMSLASRTSNGIDYITYLKRQNIRATMFFPEITQKYYDSLIYHNIGVFEEAKINLYRKIFSLKSKFELAVSRTVLEPNASFINGILLGSRQSIPDDLKEAFNKTGTTHILAISGYNIMIISWAVLTGLIVFFRRRIAFWMSVATICVFVILTGASASVVRAAIMGLLLSFAHGYGRLYDQKNSIILAGAAMVWINPFALTFDIGFQLSFAAVLGLTYLYPWVDYKLRKAPKLGNVKELFLMTLSAQIAVAPLLIYYFGNFSLISLPTNLMILPFIPAAMFMGFVTGLAGMILPVAGEVVGWFAWAITTYQVEIVRLFAGF